MCTSHHLLDNPEENEKSVASTSAHRSYFSQSILMSGKCSIKNDTSSRRNFHLTSDSEQSDDGQNSKPHGAFPNQDFEECNQDPNCSPVPNSIDCSSAENSDESAVSDISENEGQKRKKAKKQRKVVKKRNKCLFTAFKTG
ncbi:hypothetical protein GE061_008777 [Apolygus lucorum]|uniref:Uncharacterized protein n=1 Tax=Apolygus lucorum TaxID=248454 RepID=A0A8S9WKG3_APOLU|nr:hypothetical protein GE061_008777 [Apolygus lucorum]